MSRNRKHPVDPQDEEPFNVFLHQYIESNTHDRIDLLACTKKITGLLFYSDDCVSTLSNIHIERLTKQKKEIQGTTGNLSNYYVFKTNIKHAVANFASFTTATDDEDNLPGIIDSGHLIKKVKNRTRDQEIKKELDSFVKLPSEDNKDVMPFYLPVAIPLFDNHIFDGPIDQEGLADQLYEVNPALSLWLWSITSNNFSPQVTIPHQAGTPFLPPVSPTPLSITILYQWP